MCLLGYFQIFIQAPWFTPHKTIQLDIIEKMRYFIRKYFHFIIIPLRTPFTTPRTAHAVQLHTVQAQAAHARAHFIYAHVHVHPPCRAQCTF
jgi:hypothetical protein